MNKHTRSVSLIDGHTEDERGITDTEKVLLELKSASEWFAKHGRNTNTAIIGICNRAVDLINRKDAVIAELQHKNDELEAEIERLNVELVGMRGACESYKMHYDNAQAEIERYKSEHKDFVRKLGDLHSMTIMVMDRRNEIKSEAIKELSEKITEIFMRYAHLHTYAEGARKDFIETVDGKEIEMQSVWDVFTLKKYGIAGYEEMNRLQTNIELIEKGRLLAELKKDFRVLVKEMTE